MLSGFLDPNPDPDNLSKKFKKKSFNMFYYLKICYQFDNILFYNDHKNGSVGSGSVINCPPGAGSGTLILDYGSADPDPNKIVTDPKQ